jgi:hypothetical protein
MQPGSRSSVMELEKNKLYSGHCDLSSRDCEPVAFRRAVFGAHEQILVFFV